MVVASATSPAEVDAICAKWKSVFPAAPAPTPTTRPYAATSRFNTLVDTRVARSSKERDVVANIAAQGPFKLVIDETPEWDYQHPLYRAKDTDPLFTASIRNKWTGNCHGAKFRLPQGARQAAWTPDPGSKDAHLSVVQPDGTEFDFHRVYNIDWNTKTLDASYGSTLPFNGDGLGGGSTVANFGLWAGVIRHEEMAAGNIPHALFVTIPKSDGTHVSWLKTNGNGAIAPDAEKYKWPPLGTHFYLSYTDAEINALPIPTWRKTVVRAATRYGMYFGDTGGGSTGFKFQLESPETYRSLGKTDPWLAWAQANGVPLESGKYRLDVRSGVDWLGRLRMVA